MDPRTLKLTEAELKNAIPGSAARARATMKEHPELLKLSPFALECMELNERQLGKRGSPTPRNASAVSPNLSATTSATVLSQYTPDEYERTSYYNGIAGASDHPELVYRSDFLTNPFPKPVGRYPHIPVKSVYGAFNTPLNGVWGTVGPAVGDIIKARKIKWSSLGLVRFFTNGPPGEEEEKGSLGPVVVWVGVVPGSTSSDTAHEVSQEILALLRKNGVEDAVVEWRESLNQRLVDSRLD